MKNDSNVTWEQFAVVMGLFVMWAGWASVTLVSMQKSVALLEFSVFHKTAAVKALPQSLLSYPMLPLLEFDKTEKHDKTPD